MNFRSLVSVDFPPSQCLEKTVVLVDLSGQDQAKLCRKCTGKRVHDRRAARRNRHFAKGNHDDEEAIATVWITTKEKVQSERKEVKFDTIMECIEEDKEETDNERHSHNGSSSTGYQISHNDDDKQPGSHGCSTM